jgi:hypothetical protein
MGSGAVFACFPPAPRYIGPRRRASRWVERSARSESIGPLASRVSPYGPTPESRMPNADPCRTGDEHGQPDRDRSTPRHSRPRRVRTGHAHEGLLPRHRPAPPGRRAALQGGGKLEEPLARGDREAGQPAGGGADLVGRGSGRSRRDALREPAGVGDHRLRGARPRLHRRRRSIPPCPPTRSPSSSTTARRRRSSCPARSSSRRSGRSARRSRR